MNLAFLVFLQFLLNVEIFPAVLTFLIMFNNLIGS